MSRNTDKAQATRRPPVVAWLGPAPSAEVEADIRALADLSLGPNELAAINVVWGPAAGAMTALIAGSTTPSIVVYQGRPPKETRTSWTAAGAVDVVSTAALPVTLARHLEAISEARPVLPDTEPPPEPPLEPPLEPGPTAATSTGLFEAPALGDPTPVGELPRSEPRMEDRLADRAPSLGSGPLFPTFEVDPPLPETEAPSSLAPEEIPAEPQWSPEDLPEWIDALERYLDERARWLRRARAKLRHYLELCHLRDQVPMGTINRPSVDVFGQAKGREVPPLGWPVLVRHAVGDGPVQVNDGSLQRVGTDGLVVELNFQVGPRQRLLLDLPVGAHTNAQIMVESRWQRRLGLSRWHIGGLIIQMRRVSLSEGGTEEA